ncbi:MAG TPA: 4-hydroxy-3-methylbut-2-enyl diphosphate reductase, partial [bacterium]|nr:4-hydroxy-3-methylbut-2-enyl diphosphate reductase [bacterium]
MEVIQAQTAGFCMGVRRAVDMVLEVSKRPTGRIVTYGPLIHNPQVLELLKIKGVEAISNPSDSAGATVVVRAHGISPQVRTTLQASSASVCDATCPHVLRAQHVIQKHASKGFFAVIVGDEGHAEVEGLLGCAGVNGAVVGSASEVETLPKDLDAVCVVAQTTQNQETFDSVCQALRERYSQVKIFNTICSATHDRQEEVRSISKQVDAMVIVGGRNSANTLRLAEIAQANGVQTFLVESEEELDLETLSKFKKVGITAGASTPYWMIDRVVETVKALPMEKRGRAFLAARELLLILLKGNLMTALGAASVSYTIAALLFEKFDTIFCTIAATYVLSMHIFNSYADRHSAMFNEPFMARFYSRYGFGLQSLGVIAAAISLTLAGFQGELT